MNGPRATASRNAAFISRETKLLFSNDIRLQDSDSKDLISYDCQQLLRGFGSLEIN